MNDKKSKIIIEPCLGIKIFAWSLISIFTIPIIFLIIVMIKYSDYSLIYFFLIGCIIVINLGVFFEMLGTRFIIYSDSVVIVKRFFQKVKINILDISGFKCSFMSFVKGEYPDNLKIYHNNQETNFNKGLYTKKDMKKIFSFFEVNSIPKI